MRLSLPTGTVWGRLIGRLAIAFIFAACAPRLKTVRYVLPNEAARPEGFHDQSKRNKKLNDHTCLDWKQYVYDSAYPTLFPGRYLRMNVHIMDRTDTLTHRSHAAARTFVHALIRCANADLDTNMFNWRSPWGAPIHPKGIRFALAPQPGIPGDDGVYIHRDDSLYWYVAAGKYQNNYDHKVVRKYAVGLDSIINVFIQVHPRDSFYSKTYRAVGQGIALGNALKMAGVLESREDPESFDGLLTHEVGHILGLNHAWSEDGCDDTNRHSGKCWDWTPDPPCNANCSNNMMDYNAHQYALSACQVAKIRSTMSNIKGKVRSCLIPNWCAKVPGMDVMVKDSLALTGSFDLSGDLIVPAGAKLSIHCRVSLPEDGAIIVEPGGQLYLNGCRLHNACGKPWKGILVQKKGKLKGKVVVEEMPLIELSGG